MKTLITIILMLISTSVFCQHIKSPIYIFFNSESSISCVSTIEQQDIHGSSDEVKMYEKTVQSNGDIFFYVCGELFEHLQSDSVDTCTITRKGLPEFSKVTELSKIVNEENPLYPSLVFKNIYIMENTEKEQWIKYKVKWKYYIH